jgi:hypothetical protein
VGLDNVACVGVVRIHSPILSAAIAAATSLAAVLLGSWGSLRNINRSRQRHRTASIYSAPPRLSSPSSARSASGSLRHWSTFFLKDVQKLTPRKIGALLSVILGMFLISWEGLRLIFSGDRKDDHQRGQFHQHNMSVRQL